MCKNKTPPAAMGSENDSELTNVNGSPSRIRLRKVSRLGNAMGDETYAYDGGDWTRFDNISQASEELVVDDSLDADGTRREERIVRDAAGAVLSRTVGESRRFGSFANAVLRQTRYAEKAWDGDSWNESFASYYTDNDNPKRNGSVRLEWGNARAWRFRAYDAEGRAILTLDQHGGSECPEAPLLGLAADAFDGADAPAWLRNQSFTAIATVSDYTPLAGDAAVAADADRVRTESRYLVENGSVTLIGRTWTRYTRGAAYGRMVRNDGSVYAYDSAGRLASVSNATAVAEYRYSADGLDAGYSITLPNGVVFTRSVSRDGYRRPLVTNIVNSAAGTAVETLAYSYDALNRPVSRNGDAFGYNDRGEVTNATVAGESDSYGYDEIGNSTDWAANGLNQYAQFAYDPDGNLLSDGVRTFAYDAANRLRTVSTNGILILTNSYDAKSRRVRKVTPEATTTFFYDDWNLIEERIAYANGTTSTIHYCWGKDLSSTPQGAGGVGRLLYLTVDGAVHVPFYDNIGNVTRYLDADGKTVAAYTYDAFGNLIAASGPLAGIFRFRFSTKYFDAETSLSYYGYRFYHPALMRWLNRDPIEEEGGR